MPTLSRQFKAAVKLADQPAYKLARAVGAHPTWLSQALHGAVTIRPGDPRLLKIGKRLGLRPDEVFEAER